MKKLKIILSKLPLTLLLITVVILSCKNPKYNIIVKNYPNYYSNNDSTVILLDLSKFKTFNDLIKRIDKIYCDDSIPKITLKTDTHIKNIYPIAYCYEKFACILIKEKNIIEIHNDIVIKADRRYSLDSLIKIMTKDYFNFGKDPFYSSNPKKIVLYISYNENGLKKLPKLLEFITNTFEEINTKNELRISLHERIKILPPPPMPKKKIIKPINNSLLSVPAACG